MRNRICIALLAMTALAAGAFAASNIDPAAPYAWSENAGWINFRGNGDYGVVVTSDILSGFAWCENVGWLNLGDGTPESGAHYSNTSGTDFGVNNDGAGNLSGYAWGENIGWVNFDTLAAEGSQVVIAPDGSFSGYAWCENIGWITMATGHGVRLTGGLDADGDGLPDATELELGTDPYNADSDDDGLSDYAEVYYDGDLTPNIYDPVTNPTGTDLDPNNPDTDGDGVNDGAEVSFGFDPLDPGNTPELPVLTVTGLAALLAALILVGLRWGRKAKYSCSQIR